MTFALSSTQTVGCTVLLSVVVFRIALFVLKKQGRYPSSICDGALRIRWLYRNIWISFSHSFITSVMSVFCFYKEPAMLSDLIDTWTWLSYYLVCISLGYFIHDFFDMALNDSANSGVLLVHHVVVIGAYGLSAVAQKNIGFVLCSLLMEINSVFLHSRRLMSFHGVSKKSTIYEINGIFLIITFIAFRFLSSGWMLNFVITNRHIIPLTHTIYGSCGMCAIIVHNIQLFSVIWKSDFKKRFQVKAD